MIELWGSERFADYLTETVHGQRGTTSLVLAETLNRPHSEVLAQCRSLMDQETHRSHRQGQGPQLVQRTHRVQGQDCPYYWVNTDAWMHIVLGAPGPEAEALTRMIMEEFYRMKQALGIPEGSVP